MASDLSAGGRARCSGSRTRHYLVRTPIDAKAVIKKEQIHELFARFEAAGGVINGVECWSARELQTVLGYAEWRNFTTVVEKAHEACKAAGEAVSGHFAGIGKMVTLG